MKKLAVLAALNGLFFGAVLGMVVDHRAHAQAEATEWQQRPREERERLIREKRGTAAALPSGVSWFDHDGVRCYLVDRGEGARRDSRIALSCVAMPGGAR